MRNPEEYDLSGIDAVIHLSSIANDPAGDLDPKLTWEVNCLATMQLADKARRQGVKRFAFASSGSVYGVKKELQVTEAQGGVTLAGLQRDRAGIQAATYEQWMSAGLAIPSCSM